MGYSILIIHHIVLKLLWNKLEVPENENQWSDMIDPQFPVYPELSSLYLHRPTSFSSVGLCDSEELVNKTRPVTRFLKYDHVI